MNFFIPSFSSFSDASIHDIKYICYRCFPSNFKEMKRSDTSDEGPIYDQLLESQYISCTDSVFDDSASFYRNFSDEAYCSLRFSSLFLLLLIQFCLPAMFFLFITFFQKLVFLSLLPLSFFFFLIQFLP